MKKLVFLHVLLVITVKIGSSEDLDQKWKDYKIKFGKSYRNPQEDQMRKNLFAGSLKHIQEHNEMYSKHKTTFQMGVNQFTDMTPDELQKWFMGKK